MAKQYHKLVRDRIPEIIRAGGKSCVTETLSDGEYLRLLDVKLSEELADLLEVMRALVTARGCTWEQLEQIRQEKRTRRGGFEERILLLEVE